MRPAIMCGVFGVLAANGAAAQEGDPNDRSGFWWSVHAGPAWATMDCGRCEALPDSIPYAGGLGFGGGLAVGGTLTERWRLGVALSVYGRQRGRRSASIVSVGPVVRFRPSGSHPHYLSVSVGLSGSSLAGGGTLIEATGTSVELGAGMTIGSVRGFAVTAQGSALAAFNTRGSASISGDNPGADPPRQPRMALVGIGLRRR